MSNCGDLKPIISQAQAGHILFKEAERSLNAGQLRSLASSLARKLLTLGIKPSSRVCLYLPGKLDATIAVYGILHMGGCYVPIDYHTPEQRLRFIVADAKSDCCIGSGERPGWLDADIAYLNINDIVELDPASSISECFNVNSEAIAALLYTSGSTGTPKGVAISHRAIRAFVSWSASTFDIKASDRLASLTPFHFDLSLFDLFIGLQTGASTLFIPETLKLMPGRMLDWFESNQITSWYTVPSILKFLLMRGGLADRNLPALRQILFAGEVFPSPQLKELLKLMPHTQFYNLFGPTETNVCLYWPVSFDNINSAKPIPVGIPAGSIATMISDKNGELLIKSPYLMSGYWSNGKLDLPLDEQGWFHTNDLVSLNKQNEFEYHGRLDRMIKSAGYRVEPAEVEAAICTLKDVTAAAVIALPDSVSGAKIAALVAGEGLSLPAIRKGLSKLLPAYMQPGAYQLVETLPLLSNGKTDFQSITTLFKEKTTA